MIIQKPFLIFLFAFLGSTFLTVASADSSPNIKPTVSDCLANIGALDFGSGSFKALVIEVDTCQKKLGQVIFSENLPTKFNDALEKSKNSEIPLAVVKSYSSQIKDIIKKMNSYQTKKIFAVATSVFRSAQNRNDVIQELSKVTETAVEIISQEMEAELGYLSALVDKNLNSQEKVIVWDIGGGSMQMFSSQKNDTHIYKGDLASVTFKNKVIKEIQNKDPSQVSSPNPLGKNYKKAIAVAKDHASQNVPDFFKKNSKNFRWIGVGGVLALSIQAQIGSDKKQFTLKQLKKTLRQRSKLSDNEIDSKYKETEVSNLALVLGYMKQLKIEKVETANVSLGHGLIYKKMLQ